MRQQSSRLRAGVRRAAAAGLWSLRVYWGTAALLAATAAVGLAALLPVTALLGAAASGFTTRLTLPAWRGGDLGMGWSAFAASPTATEHEGLAMLVSLLASVAAGVLAVAGLTVLSLSAARASQRAFEMDVRRAVGASRGMLLTAGLVEGAAIAIGAVIVGGFFGRVAARVALAAWPGGLAVATRDVNVAAFAGAVGGVILGAVLPLAFQRRGPRPPRSSARPLELAVPALQLGFSLTVLTAAALLRREASGRNGPGAAPGVPAHVLEITAAEAPPATRAAQYASILRRLRARHTFGAVSLNSPGTLTGLGMVDFVVTDCGNCVQGGLPYPFQPVRVTYYLVSADTFRVLGLATVAGRVFTNADRWGTAPVAVVSYSLAARHFQHGEAVGRRILVGRPVPLWYTVIGVVDNQQPVGVGGGLEPYEAVYLSVLQHPAPTVDLMVPTDAQRLALLEREVRNGGRTPTRVVLTTGSALVTAEVAPLEWFGRMLRFEGAVILVIALLATFVVMQLWVRSRVPELGIRRAVGARRRDVFSYVLWRAAGVAAGGVGVGLWAGLVVWGTVATVTAGVPAWDVRVALPFVPMLAAAALGGALLPAWRAARAQPAGLTE